MEATLSATTPLAERAKVLVPLLDTHAPYGDEHSLLAPEVVDAYNEAGLLKMWVPEELGGFELGPLDSLEVLALTAYGDPSAGWVQMAASLAIGTAGSYLGETAVKELFGNGRCPVIAGQGTAPGRAKTVDGGYLLTGSWSFASGLRHGDHIHTLGIIEETGEARIFVVPVEKAELFLDSWDVMGLEGDGQHRLHDHRRLRARGLHALRLHPRAAARRLAVPPRHHRHRRRVPLGLGDGCRAPPARRTR